MADGANIIGRNDNDAMQVGRPPIKDLIMLYNEAKALRAPYENDWRMNAAYCLPRHYASWLSEGPSFNPNTQAAKRYAYDATAARALSKWAAILRRLGTPDGHKWHRLQASNPQLRKSYRVRAYMDELTNVLFKMRYDPRALFSQTADETFMGLGCYGTAPIRFKWRNPSLMDRRGGFAYKSMSLKDSFPLANADGHIDTMFVRQYINARQFNT